MKTAIVCNTPLQIMNAINIVINNVESTKDNTDIFIIQSFKKCSEISNRIEESQLFNKVFYCTPKAKTISRFVDLLDTKKIFELYEYNNESFVDNKYEQIFVSDRNLLAVGLNYISKGSIFVYDDGIISYVGNHLVNKNNYEHPWLNRMFKTDVYSYDIKKHYVNNKDFCKSNVSSNIEQLPYLNNNENKAIELIKKVFDYKEDFLSEHKLIIFEQPIDKKEGYNGKTFSELFDNNLYNRLNPIVRLHPVQKDVEYKHVLMDNINNLWEIDCIENVKDSNILLSYYSSAQISPKLLANKEPILIFIYKLFLSDLSSFDTKNIELSIENVKANYKNKNRIFVPENENELEEILFRL